MQESNLQLAKVEMSFTYLQNEMILLLLLKAILWVKHYQIDRIEMNTVPLLLNTSSKTNYNLSGSEVVAF